MKTGKTLIRLLLQKQSDLGLHCLSRLVWQATSVRNTFTVNKMFIGSDSMSINPYCAGYFYLSYDVASGSEITPCNKIDKPLVVYRFTGNVITSITTLRS